MRQNEEKQPINWETKDPRPPVIHSGHMENHVEHTFTENMVDKPQETGL